MNDSITTSENTSENNGSNDGFGTGTATMVAEAEPHMQNTTHTFPPPPPPPPPTAKRSWWHVPIARDPEQGKLGGVVAGIAAAYGFDLKTTRIATVIAALVVPGVVPLYIAALFFLPKSPDPARSLAAIVGERRRRPLLIALGIAAVFTGFGSWAFFGGFGWGVALVGVGVILWLAPNFGSESAATTTTTRTTMRATAGPQPFSSTASGSPYEPAGATATENAGKARRKRYPVQAFGLAVAAVGALVMGIGNGADWWNVSTFAIVIAVLATLIAASIIGVIVNRSWFGIPMLVLLMAWSAGLLVTHPNLDGGFGERTVRPVTFVEAEQPHQLSIGRMTIDLTQVPLAGQQLMVTALIGYGQVDIVVPDDVDVRLTTDVNAGHVLVNGIETSAGMRRDDVTTIAGRGENVGGGSIVLDVTVGAGEVRVTQSGS